MKDEFKPHIFNNKGTDIRILPTYSSSGLMPTFGVYYTRKITTNETILENIPISEIEKFLRKKKLKKLENIK